MSTFILIFLNKTKTAVTNLDFPFKIKIKGKGKSRMQVKVFANLRDICGGVQVEVIPEGNRVIDILDKMIEMFPEMEEEILTPQKELKPFVHVYINGKNIIHLEELETRVAENDQFALFPPVAGG